MFEKCLTAKHDILHATALGFDRFKSCGCQFMTRQPKQSILPNIVLFAS